VGKSRRKNTASRLPSASAVKYTMPRRPADSVPNCIGHVDFLTHWDSGKCRPDLELAEFAHYLVGEGKGDDGTMPVMFTRDDSPPPDAFAKAWLRRDNNSAAVRGGFVGKRWPLQQAWCAEIIARDMPGEKCHFRLMASPERRHGIRVDMRRFTREVMLRVDEDLRVSTLWSASAHVNTGIPHVHIGVRGVDANGKGVFFPPPYALRGFEYRARQVLGELISELNAAEKQVARAG